MTGSSRCGRHDHAGVIQLVECQLPKLDVAGSSPVARSDEDNALQRFLLRGIVQVFREPA